MRDLNIIILVFNNYLLGDQEEPLGILEKLIQFQNVGVIQSFEDINFADEPLALFLSKMFLIYYFDGSQGLGLFV